MARFVAQPAENTAKRASMTYKQAAEFLEVSVRQVRRFASAKLFPVYRYGHRTVRIDRSDIEKFKRKHRI